MNENQFDEYAHQIISKFGFLILSHSSTLNSFNMHSAPNLLIQVHILDPYFAIVFANEFRRSLFGDDSFSFVVPTEIVPLLLQQHHSFVYYFRKWLNQNDIRLELYGNQWIGSESNIQKVTQLIHDFPFKIIVAKEKFSSGMRKKIWKVDIH
jgi:hypothetical protein